VQQPLDKAVLVGDPALRTTRRGRARTIGTCVHHLAVIAERLDHVLNTQTIPRSTIRVRLRHVGALVHLALLRLELLQRRRISVLHKEVAHNNLGVHRDGGVVRSQRLFQLTRQLEQPVRVHPRRRRRASSQHLHDRSATSGRSL
jgi:hypothetical protein